MKRKRKLLRLLVLLTLLAFGQSLLTVWLLQREVLKNLPEDPLETWKFREMDITGKNLVNLQALSRESGIDWGTALAVQLVLEDFSLEKTGKFSAERLEKGRILLETKRPADFSQLQAGCQALLGDLEYFPVAAAKGEGQKQITFEDGYGTARTYGGDRIHEGIDLFGIREIPGYYPVISVTDGVVEQVGWLELGGYRIGIRSPHGVYFYYAHLDSYGRKFSTGDRVFAGELLGFMGDTGYGQEGTRGRFPVHLHFGMYLSGENGQEISVNPYAFLLYLENRTEEYTY